MASVVESEIPVLCADIGSISQGNFGWAGWKGGREISGTDINELADIVADGLAKQGKVALGFEAPLFVPVPRDPENLGKAREGESKAWSAAAGAQVLATALVQVAWLLERVRDSAPATINAFLDWQAFSRATHGLFLWEALVTGSAKTTTHTGDAAFAVQAFKQALPNPGQKSMVTTKRPLSLIGTALLWSGWSTDISVLTVQSPVLGAQ
jgi:hypothetical protein